MTTLVVLGGGAAGFFGALRAKQLAPESRVILLEAASTFLSKVAVSGGGRCNVTNARTDPAALVRHYPRGEKELRGVLAKFGPKETMAWFEAQGVRLKTESDLRVFPTSDDSATIVDCLIARAEKLGVELRSSAHTTKIQPSARGGLDLTLKDGTALHAEGVLLATGSSPIGWRFAQALGHTVVPGVPSLFSLNVDDARLHGLAGVAVERARLTLLAGSAPVIEQEGPVLVTHWGLSAPGVLRISAWGARVLAESGYRARLRIDWAPDASDPALRAEAARLRDAHPRGTLMAHPLVDAVPRRLWERLVIAAGATAETRWNEATRAHVHGLVQQVKNATFEVTGRGPFKEEFVTAGGVERREVDWRTMASKVCPGLYFAGEILDVDALTGGFNLQSAWSTGWLAGEAMAAIKP